MNVFLLKSILAMGLFWSFYAVFLKQEKIFRFNRFYLLASLLISFVYGLVEINRETEVLVPYTTTQNTNQTLVNSNVNPVIVNVEAYNSINFTSVLIIVYLIGFSSFVYRFLKNLYYFYKLKNQNNQQKYRESSIVLVDRLNTSFSFLNTIYLDKNQFENQEIEKELLLHEYQHIKQKHSYDVLFVEFLICFMWFNPFLYLYKSAIQLNHEFLADEATLDNVDDKKKYQYLLLQKGFRSKNNYLASNFNFLLIKNRLLMMNKNQSKFKSTLLISGALVLASFLFYSFCIKEVVVVKEQKESNEISQVKQHEKESEKQETNQSIGKRTVEYVDDEVPDAEYYKDVQIILYSKIKELNPVIEKKESYEIILSKKYQDLTKEELEKYAPFTFKHKPYEKKQLNQKEFESFKNKNKYAIWIDDVNVDNTQLNKYKPSDFAYYSGSGVYKNARTKKHPQPFQYAFYTHKYYKENKMDKWLSRYPGDSIEVWISSKQTN